MLSLTAGAAWAATTIRATIAAPIIFYFKFNAYPKSYETERLPTMRPFI
jgi:hypothetical protein